MQKKYLTKYKSVLYCNYRENLNLLIRDIKMEDTRFVSSRDGADWTEDEMGENLSMTLDVVEQALTANGLFFSTHTASTSSSYINVYPTEEDYEDCTRELGSIRLSDHPGLAQDICIRTDKGNIFMQIDAGIRDLLLLCP